MYTSLDFKRAFSEYIQRYREHQESMSAAGRIMGVFGFGRKAESAGYDQFYKEINEAVKAVCEEGPDEETADSIIDVIFGARKLYGDENIPEVTFIAIEGSSVELIPFMSPGKAREIYDSYSKEYPRIRRLPVQKDLIAALKKASES